MSRMAPPVGFEPGMTLQHQRTGTEDMLLARCRSDLSSSAFPCACSGDM